MLEIADRGTRPKSLRNAAITIQCRKSHSRIFSVPVSSEKNAAITVFLLNTSRCWLINVDFPHVTIRKPLNGCHPCFYRLTACNWIGESTQTELDLPWTIIELEFQSSKLDLNWAGSSAQARSRHCHDAVERRAIQWRIIFASRFHYILLLERDAVAF